MAGFRAFLIVIGNALLVSVAAALLIQGCVVVVPELPTGKGANTVAAHRVDVESLEQKIHQLVNQERRSRGLAPLSWNDTLATIARLHSQDMAANRYFDHINKRGEDPTARAKKADYSCIKRLSEHSYSYGVAENIFQTHTYSSVAIVGMRKIFNWLDEEEIARQVVEGWMQSPGHRQNILNPQYEAEGIGVAVNTSGEVYVTQDFC